MQNHLQEEPQSGKVCRKCWCKVGLFHEFYMRIEEIHTTVFPSTVVIEDLIQNFKDEADLKNESNDFDGFSEFMDDDDFATTANDDNGMFIKNHLIFEFFFFIINSTK